MSILSMCLALGGMAQGQDDVLHYNRLFMEAMVQRQQGHDDAAFDLLQRCIDINPKASESYYFLAHYYTKLKNREQALSYFKQAADLEPDNPTYMETLSQAYIMQGDFASATEVIEHLYESRKDRTDLLEMLYGLYLRQDDYDNAIRILNQLETIDGKSERLAYAKSEIYTQQGNKEAAIAETKALADQYPNDLNYLAQYADMLMKNDEEQQALDVLGGILADEPGNVHALMSMRSYYKAQADSAAADAMTRRLLFSSATDPGERLLVMRQEIIESERLSTDSTYILNLFRQLLAQDDVDVDMAALCATYMELKKMPKDSVTPVLEQILQMAPDNAAARLRLVAYAWQDDDMGRIISLCQAARQYNPDEMAFYYYQGMAYYKQDDHDQALNAFRNGISVINDDSDPAIVSDFYAVMGDLLHQKGLAGEAFAAYDSCLHHKSDNIGCLNNYAYYLSELGQQLDKAEQMSNKAIKAEPKNATYLDTFAWILFKQKRYAEARIYIDEALANDTDASAVILEHAGDIYYMAKDTARALELWQASLAKSPDNKVLTRKIKLKKYVKE